MEIDGLDQTGSTMGVPVSQPRPRLERGTCVSRYVIVDALGEGGMGVVYHAYDPELERFIALKLMSGQGELFGQRLLREAQALARLSHPNVVTVYDVGTFGSDVFIAMELIQGQTLRSWLKQEQRSQKAILEVFKAAGAGLAAAHRAGMVHRDFKPDNVMIGNDGRICVVDFGLARASDGADTPGATPLPSGRRAEASPPLVSALSSIATRAVLEGSTQQGSLTSGSLMDQLTRVGAVIGTPRYMAPEQHLGETVDARCDQFSFCVALYEALCGALPFDGRTVDELRDSVLRGRVGTQATRMPRWLRQPVLRGLSVRTDDRFATLEALLAGLQDPRQRRRRRLLAMGAATLALVTAGWWVTRPYRLCRGAEQKLNGVWDAGRREAVRAAFDKADARGASRALRVVETSFDAFAHAWVAMHVDACRATEVRGQQSQEMLALRMSCLADGLLELRSLGDLFTSADASTVAKAAESAQSLPSLAGCADASALRSAVLPPADLKTRAAVDGARQVLSRARALESAGKYKEGIQAAETLLPIIEKLRYKPIEAEARLRLGMLHMRLGDYRDGAQNSLDALVAALSGRHDRVAASAATLMMYAAARSTQLAEANRWSHVAEGALERLHGDAELLGAFHGNRSWLRNAEGRYQEALADALKAVELLQRLYGPQHHQVATAWDAVGRAYFDLGQPDKALEAYQKAIDIDQKLFGLEHPSVAGSVANRANVLGDSGDHMRAIAEYRRAQKIFERLNPSFPDLAVIHINLGTEYQSLGRHEEARDEYQRAYDHVQHTLGESKLMVAALLDLAANEAEMGHAEAALDYSQRGMAVAERVLSKSHPHYAETLRVAGEAQRMLGRLDQAMASLQRSLELNEKALGPKHIKVMWSLFGIGRVHLARHQPALAVPILERALAIRLSQPSDGLEAAAIKLALAGAAWGVGDRERARRLATEVRDVYAAAGRTADAAEAKRWLAHPTSP